MSEKHLESSPAPQGASRSATTCQIEATIERFTFHSAENGYSVVRLKAPGNRELVTATGNLAGAHVGERIRCQGQWVNHPKFGPQFKIAAFATILPDTAQGLERFLGSGLIKGVGKATARRLIEAFGTEIVAIIEQEPDRLLEIPGLGRKRAAIVCAGWTQHQQIKQVMVFLQGHGVSATFAVKIFKRYGNDSISVVQADPYRLAEDIWGIGFKTADKIAQALGMAADSPQRIRAGIAYALSQHAESGHVFAFEPELVSSASSILEVPGAAVQEGLAQLCESGKLLREPLWDGQAAWYLPPLAYAEIGLANRLRALSKPRATQDESSLLANLPLAVAQAKVPLSDEQVAAVRAALASPIMVLTGGPGTGKSTTCNTILAAFEALGRRVVLASPTGRAAKRLAELTGRTACTIHRLLEFDPKTMGFKRGSDYPLDGDVFVFDEVSMLDVLLANDIFKALPAAAQVLLVGDPDQLPSVGPGAVLRELLASGRIPCRQLTTIFRQAQSSLIVTNAHRINRGEFPVLLPPSAENHRQNAFFLPADEPEEVLKIVLDLVTRRLPAKGNRPEDIQILCPMNRGSVGATALNLALQESLNPDRPDKPATPGYRRFKVNDRVIQLRNNYHLEVFNGDVGTVTLIDLEDHRLVVSFPEKDVTYDFSDLDELNLAYALSVHKAQGSEFPVVIVPVTTQHFPMLQRNLLYTAVTRAKKLLILVGSRKAVAIAVKNSKMLDRNSRLAERLQG